MKIVQVLRTLMLNPEGSALTNEMVCEVMLSCFRICFEPRLNELLRRTAEHALKDIVLLLFMRLPQFTEERVVAGLVRKLKMIAGSIEQPSKKRKIKSKASNENNSKPTITRSNSLKTEEICLEDQLSPHMHSLRAPVLATTPATPAGNIVDMQGQFMQTPPSSLASSEIVPEEVLPATDTTIVESASLIEHQDSIDNDADVEDAATQGDDLVTAANASEEHDLKGEDFVNSMGVRFTPQTESGNIRFSSNTARINWYIYLNRIWSCTSYPIRSAVHSGAASLSGVSVQSIGQTEH